MSTLKSAPEIFLTEYFFLDLVEQVVEKRVFGGPFLRFYNYLKVSMYLYQSGALLGLAKIDQMPILAQMYCVPGSQHESINRLQESAKKRLGEYERTFGEEPKSLDTFISATEYQRAGIIMSIGRRSNPTDSNPKEVARVRDGKLRFKDIDVTMQFQLLEGIGFGSLFPDLTERMYRKANDNIDLNEWELAQKRLGITSPLPVITLEEEQQRVLGVVAAYANLYFPELIEPLNLTNLLSPPVLR